MSFDETPLSIMKSEHKIYDGLHIWVTTLPIKSIPENFSRTYTLVIRAVPKYCQLIQQLSNLRCKNRQKTSASVLRYTQNLAVEVKEEISKL